MWNLENFSKIITVNGNQYRVNLAEDGNKLRVYASPCCLPSAVFEVAEIIQKDNCCNEFDFYEAMIYTDPVVCIIDCNLCRIIERCLETYIENFNLDCNNNQRRCGFFGF